MRWRDVIEHRVAHCTLMLVLIGDEWLEARDGVRKIERAEDPVRFEIAAGLVRLEALVLPVLVEEARMPSAGSLPPEVRGLCDWNAHSIHDGTYEADVNTLVASLRTLAGTRNVGAQKGGLSGATDRRGKRNPARSAGKRWRGARCLG